MNLKKIDNKLSQADNSDFEESAINGKLKKVKRLNFKKIFFIIIFILAIGGTVTSAYYFKQYKNLKANPNLEVQKEMDVLIKTIGKLIELPSDETPTVATISNKEKLKDQLFFAKAENGDKLIAFTKAMQAILYRPSTNKIINVAPIVIDQEDVEKQKKPVSAISEGLKIAYYNGTETLGLASESEEIVKKKYPNYQTSIIGNATNKNYKENIVIDLTGKYQAETNSIANLLGGKVGILPEGEKRPESDILVISGK